MHLRAARAERIEDRRCEMQTGGRRSHRALDTRIHGLIVISIDVLGVTLQVWRDWDITGSIDN